MSVIHHKNDLAAVDTSGGWTSDVGPLAVLDTIKFNVDGGLGIRRFHVWLRQDQESTAV